MAVVLSVRIGVGGCILPKSLSIVLMMAPFWAFSNIALISASLEDAKTFFSTLHSTQMGALCGALVGSDVKSVRKN